MIKLLKVPEILCKQSAKIALGLLEELRSSDGIPTRILQHPTSEQALLLIRNSFEETSNRSQDKALISINSNIIERIEELIHNAPGGKFARKNPITIDVYLKNVFILEVKLGLFFLFLANFPPGAL
jgi:hypothetical protein